ncbi:hypothetical protein [Fredinandcohnia quinoae]|uniref:Uncharacterized protein n=1 Tax=Fredinandcohnia quinoae TaxID=2918902 RepID=A0AAW5E089_9BACI|nr:hypothetical protein [Fredinandcohnia sp. SECRCQ15]MCH1626326.1 hypothetical protein [Fredinandcohnia sp. SECRCQ15]
MNKNGINNLRDKYQNKTEKELEEEIGFYFISGQKYLNDKNMINMIEDEHI